MDGWIDICITVMCNIGYIYLYDKGSTINGDNGYHSLTLGLLVLCNICMPLIFQSMTAARVGDNIALQKLSEILEVLSPFHIYPYASHERKSMWFSRYCPKAFIPLTETAVYRSSTSPLVQTGL